MAQKPARNNASDIEQADSRSKEHPQKRLSKKTGAGSTTTAKERREKAREKARAAANESITIFGRTMRRENLFRLGGLLAFFVLVAIVIALVWPLFGQFFEPDGRAKIMESLRNAGPLGVLMLLGMQLLQVVVAFIPGEVVQIAAGAMYGPIGGTIIVLLGCVIASWFIYEVVHRLGQPFVSSMVPTKYLDKFRSFEEKGKLAPLVFILFLIPGLPKDTFAYLVPLTNMDRNRYLILSTLGRTPGVFLSTFAASGLMDGNVYQGVAVLVALAIVAGVGILFKDRIIDLLGKEH